MAEKFEVRYEESDGKEFGFVINSTKVHRAAIRFAPGPHGEVFTDWYMGRKGVEIAVNQFRLAFDES